MRATELRQSAAATFLGSATAGVSVPTGSPEHAPPTPPGAGGGLGRERGKTLISGFRMKEAGLRKGGYLLAFP